MTSTKRFWRIYNRREMRGNITHLALLRSLWWILGELDLTAVKLWLS
ncbi:MAG: hypothetical protein WCP16_19165 [Pseudanabaena sp. ELA645]